VPIRRRAPQAGDRDRPNQRHRVAVWISASRWRTFLRLHIHQLVAADFVVVPTVTAVSCSCSSCSRRRHVVRERHRHRRQVDRPAGARRAAHRANAALPTS
jgi:hypothetical protein